MSGRGWHGRGYLPHLEVAGRATGITFRLADSLPTRVVEGWWRKLGDGVDGQAATDLARLVAAYEDAGCGSCWLRRSDCAKVVAETLMRFDGDRYQLLEWCVMPNHVHVLVRLKHGHHFEPVVRSWKNFTARWINRQVGRTGRLWAPDYFDRLIRDEDHLLRARDYIRMNPVKAGLCRTPWDWRWSSAWKGERDRG